MTFPNPYNLPEVFGVFAQTAAGITAGSNANGYVFVQGLSGGGAAPTLAAGAGAGSGASVGTQAGHDLGGSFVITTAGTPAAGALASVVFGAALAAAPAMVLLNCWDKDAAAAVAVGPTSITSAGFTVSTGATPTTAHHLLVNYLVLYA